MTHPTRFREYASPLRREQAPRTREAILAAFAEQLQGGDASDLSAADAAERAGVSVRTVYHYFPDRATRLKGLALWVEGQLHPVPFVPRTADDLVELTRIVNEDAKHNEALTRLQLAPGIVSEIRAIRRSGRVEAIRAVVADIGAPENETRLASALIAHLISAEAGVPLIDRYGLSFDDASAAAQMGVAAASSFPNEH